MMMKKTKKTNTLKCLKKNETKSLHKNEEDETGDEIYSVILTLNLLSSKHLIENNKYLT